MAGFVISTGHMIKKLIAVMFAVVLKDLKSKFLHFLLLYTVNYAVLTIDSNSYYCISQTIVYS